MTRSEWDRIAAVLDNGFPGHFGEAESATYWTLLGHRPAKQVEDAVRKAVDKALKFRPTPSELVGLMSRAQASRRELFESQFRAFSERIGLERTIEYMDPKGELKDFYPRELGA